MILQSCKAYFKPKSYPATVGHGLSSGVMIIASSSHITGQRFRRGRGWGVQDPMMQYFNPYVAMGNNPVNQIDPNGGWNYAPTTPGDGNNNEETPLAGGSGGGGFSAMLMKARMQDSYLGNSGSSWLYKADGTSVRNEAYFDQLMNPAGGVSFSFYKSSFNGASTGVFSSFESASNSISASMDKYITDKHGSMINSFSNSGGGELMFDSEFTYTSADGSESKKYFNKPINVKGNLPINMMACDPCPPESSNWKTFLNYFEEGSADPVNGNSNMFSKKSINNTISVFSMMSAGAAGILAKGAYATASRFMVGLSIANDMDDLTGASSNISDPVKLNNVQFIKASVDAVGVASGMRNLIIYRKVSESRELIFDGYSQFNYYNKK